MVCKAALLDYGYGGEVKPGPVEFLVGAYEYDAAAGTAAVTPFQGVRTDFAGLMEQRVGQIKPRTTKVDYKRVTRWVGTGKARHKVTSRVPSGWHFTS
jgi:hypothetical protein